MSYAKEFLKKAEEEADNCKCTELEKQKIVHLNERLQDKDKLAEERKEELSRTTNQLEKAQKRIESLETVNERFNNLRIEDVRITQENQKLKEENNKLREENLTQKINFREDKLNRLIFRLNINDNLIQKLQSAYKLSFRLQANDDNQSDIREIRKNISRAAAGNLDEAETFCELCRDIADLQVQLEQFRSEQTKGKNQALVEFSSHKN